MNHKAPFDKVLQHKINGKTYYTLNIKYSRGTVVTFCDRCGDTSFELLERGKRTAKCCRCGEKYVSHK